MAMWESKWELFGSHPDYFGAVRLTDAGDYQAKVCDMNDRLIWFGTFRSWSEATTAAHRKMNSLGRSDLRIRR